jgi:hypothetical protein
MDSSARSGVAVMQQPPPLEKFNGFILKMGHWRSATCTPNGE